MVDKRVYFNKSPRLTQLIGMGFEVILNVGVTL